MKKKLPIDHEVIRICEEFKLNTTTAVLNGGEDYELLFTVDQKEFDKIKNHPLLSIIGHACDLGRRMPTYKWSWTTNRAYRSGLAIIR